MPPQPSMTQAYGPHACCADSSRASTATTLRQLRLARRGHAANLPEQPARVWSLLGYPRKGLSLQSRRAFARADKGFLQLGVPCWGALNLHDSILKSTLGSPVFGTARSIPDNRIPTNMVHETLDSIDFRSSCL